MYFARKMCFSFEKRYTNKKSFGQILFLSIVIARLIDNFYKCFFHTFAVTCRALICDALKCRVIARARFIFTHP